MNPWDIIETVSLKKEDYLGLIRERNDLFRRIVSLDRKVDNLLQKIENKENIPPTPDNWCYCGKEAVLQMCSECQEISQPLVTPTLWDKDGKLLE